MKCIQKRLRWNQCINYLRIIKLTKLINERHKTSLVQCCMHFTLTKLYPANLTSYQHILCNLMHFLHATAKCFARLCHRLGVCLSVRPSVCPSVTLVICIKTVQARITISSLWAAPRCLVYRDKISCHWVQGFSSNEGVKEGYTP